MKLLFIKLFRFGIKLLDLIVPKDNTLVLFGFSPGKYRDNTRYLFEYFMENRLRGICFTSDQNIIDTVTNMWGDVSVKLYSIRSLWIFLRAKVVVYSHGHANLYYLLSNRSRKVVVNLWHGTPIKKLGHVYAERTHVPKKIFEVHADLLTVSSRIESYVMRSVFRDSVDHIVPTGSPRNDVLVANAQDGKSISDLLNLDFVPDHVILYAPTYRYPEECIFFPFENFDFDGLKSLCEENNCLLLLRGHVNDNIRSNHNLDVLFEEGWMRNINDIPDVTDILHTVTLLLTDYSGIFFDYLLLDRPMIFIPYDLEQYEAEIGFLYPYETMVPGPLVRDGNMFMLQLRMYFNNEDPFRVKRSMVADLMHDKYTPGESCALIASLIEVLVNE